MFTSKENVHVTVKKNLPKCCHLSQLLIIHSAVNKKICIYVFSMGPWLDLRNANVTCFCDICYAPAQILNVIIDFVA